MTLVELGDDWERTEVLHKKFEEFQEELTARKGKVDKVNQYANECAQVRWKQKRSERFWSERTHAHSLWDMRGI